MNNSLGNALVIEVKDLLTKVEVLEQGRTARADSQRVLIVRDRHALVRRQHGRAFLGGLVKLSTAAAGHGLVSDLHAIQRCRFLVACHEGLPAL